MNPCICWNLKDGCVTVGIWTLLVSVSNLALFGWQTGQIKWYKDQEATNARLPAYGRYGDDRREFPAFYETVFQSDLEKFYTGLFVVQILCLIVAFFLLFTSVALIYGVHTNSRYLAWPWFPCVGASILCSLAYCIMWWAGDIRSYWMVLTIIQIVCVFINVYCLVCVIVWYRRLVTNQAIGSDDAYYDGEKYQHQQNGILAEPYDDGQQGYLHPQDPKNTVVYYNGQAQRVEQIKDNQFAPATQQQRDGYPQQYGEGRPMFG